MRPIDSIHHISPAHIWAGRVLSGLVIAFLLFDGAIKLVPIAPVTDALTQNGLFRGY